jgi:hypothetical protein
LANWKSVSLVLVLAGCASAPVTSNTLPAGTTNTAISGGLTGAAVPRLAVEQFLDAAHAGDLQAMSAVFGTDKGPARDIMDRDQLEKREIILQCFFNADSHRIVSETVDASGHHVVRAELTKNKLVRQPNFFVVRGPGDRWYVDNMEIAVVRDFCGQQTPGGT